MPHFPVTLRGYSRDQVDAFVARIEGTLGRGPLYAKAVTVADVAGVKFRVRMRGYRTTSIDLALETYQRELEIHQGGGRRRIPADGADRLAGLVRNVRFAPSRMREGYDEAQVDAFLDRMLVELRERRAMAGDARAARFATTRLRRGYDQSEVDGFLDHLATEIELLRQG